MSFRVVVCGGGIAAAEALLRLRRLAGDAIELCVIAPNDELVYRAEELPRPKQRRSPSPSLAEVTRAT